MFPRALQPDVYALYHDIYTTGNESTSRSFRSRANRPILALLPKTSPGYKRGNAFGLDSRAWTYRERGGKRAIIAQATTPQCLQIEQKVHGERARERTNERAGKRAYSTDRIIEGIGRSVWRSLASHNVYENRAVTSSWKGKRLMKILVSIAARFYIVLHIKARVLGFFRQTRLMFRTHQKRRESEFIILKILSSNCNELNFLHKNNL